MVGGRDFGQSKFDRARLAHRQAGSSFKPFVYTAAIAAGIPASHIIDDSPVAYPQVDGTVWEPSNFDPDFKGPITLREGLYTSTNMIAIKLGWEEVGIESVAQTARRMGIQTEIERYPSTTIGAVEVIPMQMAEAYSAFPAHGDEGPPLPDRPRRGRHREGALGAPARADAGARLPGRGGHGHDARRTWSARGTGYNAIRLVAGLPRDVPAGGKTGTTNDGTDVWFVGFTPDLLAAGVVRDGPSAADLQAAPGAAGDRRRARGPRVGTLHEAGVLRRGARGGRQPRQPSRSSPCPRAGGCPWG
ncbi:MAG: penicillin-binding transpeptidase domain-containing protein [Desulfomicrobium escambiense]|nr:penicillin-binding transpeptidase domain-containing protein [Desulfomicrobium escambiense]